MDEAKRIKNTLNDLLSLNKDFYCDLGPGRGYLSIELKNSNKNVVAVEAPFALDENKALSENHDIKMYFIEFISGDFNQIQENIDCFILAHSIAHYRYSPYYIFDKIYSKLPKGGLFYLSTVNATSFDKVLSFLKGNPIVEEVVGGLKIQESEFIHGFNKTGLVQIWDSWMHVKEYTKHEVETIFTNSGFTIEKSFFRNNHSHWKKNLIIKLFPHLSDEFVVIGRKN